MRFRALDTNLLVVLDLLLEHKSVTKTANPSSHPTDN